MEGKSERHHAGVHTGKLPFFRLAGQSNEDERKESGNHARHKRNGKAGRPGVNRFLAQSNTSGGVVGRKFFALAREVVGQRRIASYGFVNLPPVDGCGTHAPNEGVHIVGVQVDVTRGLCENLNIAMTVQGGRNTQGLGGCLVVNNNRIGRGLALVKCIGVFGTLRFDARVGEHGQFVPPNVLVEHRVARVLVGVIEAEREVPPVIGQDGRRARSGDDQGDGIGGVPRLPAWERDSRIGPERAGRRAKGRHVERVIGLVDSDSKRPGVIGFVF